MGCFDHTQSTGDPFGLGQIQEQREQSSEVRSTDAGDRIPALRAANEVSSGFDKQVGDSRREPGRTCQEIWGQHLAERNSVRQRTATLVPSGSDIMEGSSELLRVDLCASVSSSPCNAFVQALQRD